MLWAHKGRRLVPLFVPAVEVCGHGFAQFGVRVYCDEHLDRGALGERGMYLCGHVVIVHADDGLDACPVVAIHDVVGGKHVGGGYGHGSYLAQRQHGEPPLVVALEYQHHHVAPSYAQALQITRCLVGLLLELGKGKSFLFTPLAGPEQRQLVGSLFGPCVHYVVSKVEVLLGLELQVLLKVFL